MADYDLAIIGGGLNGVSVARDAAGRGLRVILLEQGDLGGAASSATPRLIHGDLSVLERRGFWRGARGRAGGGALVVPGPEFGPAEAFRDPRPFRGAPAMAAARRPLCLR